MPSSWLMTTDRITVANSVSHSFRKKHTPNRFRYRKLAQLFLHGRNIAGAIDPFITLSKKQNPKITERHGNIYAYIAMGKYKS